MHENLLVVETEDHNCRRFVHSGFTFSTLVIQGITYYSLIGMGCFLRRLIHHIFNILLLT